MATIVVLDLIIMQPFESPAPMNVMSSLKLKMMSTTYKKFYKNEQKLISISIDQNIGKV